VGVNGQDLRRFGAALFLNAFRKFEENKLLKMFMLLVFLNFIVLTGSFQHKPKIHRVVKTRALKPPFPNGPCGGTIVTLSSDITYKKVDTNIGGVLLPPRDINVWLPPRYDEYTYAKKKVSCIILP